jgi:hypothetical protein
MNEDVFNTGGPIALTNFGNAYEKGGLVPTGGAAIDITFVGAEGTSVSDLVQQELADSQNVRTDSVQVDGISATRAKYDDVFTPELRYSNIAVYVPKGSTIFKFYLSYRAGESQGAEFVNAFQSVLDSVQLGREQ